MFKRICRIVVLIILGAGLLWLVGTSYSQFAKDIELKSPLEVFHIKLPEIKEPDNQLSLPNVNADNGSPNSSSDTNSSENTNSTPNESTQQESSTPENSSVINEESSTSQPTQVQTITKEELNELISNIRVSDEQVEGKYNRDTFEKPTKSYKLDGKTYTRNKYAWHISEYLIQEEPFEYKCPYTGIVITDPAQLDFDHIVSLKTVYENCPDWWTEKEMNEYAYDMLIGVDVLNSSNRSKGAKTPSEWLPEKNIEDFCFTYLAICYKYDIAMSKVDLNVCKLEILNAMSSGERVEFINRFNEGTEEYKLQQKLLEEIQSK